MGDDSDSTGHLAAQAMLDSFASVGATHFDLTRTTRVGQKKSFRPNVSLAELASILPAMLDHSAARQRNVIVRPHGEGVTFIQLDDLNAEKLARVAPAVFLELETSPGNYQAWVAMRESEGNDFARRLRKGAGADPTASGATRVAGSLNFKDKYAPNFPRVAIRQANLGRVTDASELKRLGLVAAPEIVAEPPRMSPARSRPSGGNRKWPSYARCLDGAPLNSEETGPDTSRADFVWCMTAITWGWTTQQTAERLMEESAKAQASGRAYAELTTRNAALAVERRRQQPKLFRATEHGRR
jgi:RepB DNA-primase from phage plasmid